MKNAITQGGEESEGEAADQKGQSPQSGHGIMSGSGQAQQHAREYDNNNVQGNGLFGANDPITREQLAAMLYRFTQEQGYDVSIGQDANILSYTDAFDVAEYAISAMQWACGAGIISGTGDGSTLTPQGEATRAQAATVLMRFCEEYVTL